jgi:hypothetical protein
VDVALLAQGPWATESAAHPRSDSSQVSSGSGPGQVSSRSGSGRVSFSGKHGGRAALAAVLLEIAVSQLVRQLASGAPGSPDPESIRAAETSSAPPAAVKRPCATPDCCYPAIDFGPRRAVRPVRAGGPIGPPPLLITDEHSRTGIFPRSTRRGRPPVPSGRLSARSICSLGFAHREIRSGRRDPGAEQRVARRTLLRACRRKRRRGGLSMGAAA